RADAEGGEERGRRDAQRDGPEEAPPQVVGRGAAPGDERPHAHEEDEREEERHVDPVEEGRADRDLHAAYGLREEREHGAEEDGEGRRDEQDVVQEKRRLARDDRVELALGGERVPAPRQEGERREQHEREEAQEEDADRALGEG